MKPKTDNDVQTISKDEQPEQRTATPAEKKAAVIRVLKFALFSASAGGIQIGIFTLLNEVIFKGEQYWIAYLTALVCSVIYNFTINRKFTFKAANNVPIAMLKVAIYYAVFTPCSTLWGDALTKQAGWNEYLVLVFTMAINLSTEYLWQRFVVYRKAVDTAVRSKDKQDEKGGKYCESCGMPLTEDKDFGSEEDGSKSEDYCVYCYQNGKFTADYTMDEMIEHNLEYVEEFNKSEGTSFDREEAKEEMRKFFPSLKRWKKDDND